MIFSESIEKHIRCKSSAKKENVRFSRFCEDFIKILRKHLSEEFEIQIRDGHITAEGYSKLRLLEEDTFILDYPSRIKQLIKDISSRNRKVTLVQLEEMEKSMTTIIEAEVETLQEKIKKERRNADNKLCKSKISQSVKIHNFTDSPISPLLEDIVSNGLSEVPPSIMDVEEIKEEVLSDVKEACTKIFSNHFGYKPPFLSANSSLDTHVIELMKLAPHDQKLLTTLSTIRENFHSETKRI